MEKKNLGEKIAQLRKDQGLTQLELAEKMGVTDKAVSKWERNLSCPDVHSLPRLAQILNVTVDELMLDSQPQQKKPDNRELKLLIFRSVALAMGIVLVVLSLLGQLDLRDGFGFAGVGITALALQGFFTEKA